MSVRCGVKSFRELMKVSMRKLAAGSCLLLTSSASLAQLPNSPQLPVKFASVASHPAPPAQPAALPGEPADHELPHIPKPVAPKNDNTTAVHSSTGEAPLPIASTPALSASSEPNPLTSWLPSLPRAATDTNAVHYPTARVTGLLQLDSVYGRQSNANRLVVGRVQDSLDFRRARIGVKGNLAENTTYILEFDFAASQARFVDDYVQFAQLPLVGNIRIGHFRQPFGMSESTNYRELPFLERQTGFSLAPFRQTGVMLFDTVLNERGTIALSGYRYRSDPFGNVYTASGGYGMATRFTALPYCINDSELIHVGFDYSYNRPGGTNPIRIATSPEIFSGDVTGSVLVPNGVRIPPFVDTGIFTMADENLFNVELAFFHKNFALQSEARWAMINKAQGGTVTLPACYAAARWVLTGESIVYDRKNAVPLRITPNNPVGKGGCGAWELVARYSYIDLNGVNGKLPSGATATGGSLNNLTLGLNWYIINNAKFQFNYIHPLLNRAAIGGAGPDGLTNSDFFALRCQFDF